MKKQVQISNSVLRDVKIGTFSWCCDLKYSTTLQKVRCIVRFSYKISVCGQLIYTKCRKSVWVCVYRKNVYERKKGCVGTATADTDIKIIWFF